MYELLKAKWSRIIAKTEKVTRNRRSVDGGYAASAVLPSFLDWTAMSEFWTASSSETLRTLAFHLCRFLRVG
jgi:hypothetical protein